MREGLNYRKAEVARRGWELNFVGARVGLDSRICADQAQHEFPTSFWTLEDSRAENQRLSRVMTRQCNWSAHVELDSPEPIPPNILTESQSLPDAMLTRGCLVEQTVKLCRLPPS